MGPKGKSGFVTYFFVPVSTLDFFMRQMHLIRIYCKVTNEEGRNLQCCQIENQQSPVDTINYHFSRCPDGCLECCHNFALLEKSLPYMRAFQ